MNFLEMIKVILYGIIQGITEWLPISSTGHMILADKFINLDVSESFWDMFKVLIQLGSIMAVIVLYFKDLNPISRKKNKKEKADTFSLWIKIIISTLPACIVGYLLDGIIDDSNVIVVAIMLIVYGIAFIMIERTDRKPRITRFSEIDSKTAFSIGMFQALALVPGTSRSGATILGAVLLGTSRKVAAEYSFFLAIPVMFGASLLKVVKHYDVLTDSNLLMLLIAMITAFFVSLMVIKFFLSYIRKHDFVIFGWYRIAVGVLVILSSLVWR